MLAPPRQCYVLRSLLVLSRFNPTQDACSSATQSAYFCAVSFHGFHPTQDACSSATTASRYRSQMMNGFNPTQDACSSATADGLLHQLPLILFQSYSGCLLLR